MKKTGQHWKDCHFLSHLNTFFLFSKVTVFFIATHLTAFSVHFQEAMAIHFPFSNAPNMATIIAQELVPTWRKRCVMIG